MSAARPAFSAYGIELEYMIVDRDTLDVRPIADRLLVDGDGHAACEVRRRGMAWSNELTLHLVEVKNAEPWPSLEPLAGAFQAEVAALEQRLVAEGARLMPGGMHPWMDPARETRLWPHESAEIYAAYDRLFDCRRHGFANLQSMHLNLPFADDAEFTRLHAAVRLVLPILPALAASSPFADGRESGFLDARMAAYRDHQAAIPASMGRLIPDTTTGRAAYEAQVLAPMYEELAARDPHSPLGHEWLNARGAIPRFERNALEIRVIDMQECPRADLAIAAATVAAVRALYDRRWSALESQQAMPTETLAVILADCIRHGERAQIADPDYLRLLGLSGQPCTAGQVWRHLCEATAPAFGQELGVMLDQGSLARRIRAATGPRPGHAKLAAVYRRLCDCLAEGRQFTSLD